MDAKFKHLDYIQATITRMAANSFLFKGWSITIAAALSGIGVTRSESAPLMIAAVSTIVFWGLDAYYLWLERGFIALYEMVSAKDEAGIDFSMKIDKSHPVLGWIKCGKRLHLLLFYGLITILEIVGLILIEKAGK